MIRRHVKWIVLSAALLCVAKMAFGADCVPTRRALLIGINEYKSPSLVDLRGALNDVNMIKRVLITRFEFPEENISLLTDEQATREGVLLALNELVAQECPGDQIYFHYSGHGSQVKDTSGDEVDGMDETILPHDGRTRGIPDIRDDELEQLFARLRSRNVLLVFDSCNSGTVTRSVTQVRSRFVPPDERAELYRDLDTRTRGIVPVEELRHVLMTSAPAGGNALDGPLDDGFYGVFSFSLGRSLDSQGPGASPAQILDGVKRELRRIQEQFYASAPEPQLEGPADKFQQPILRSADTRSDSDAKTPRRAWLAVQPVSPDEVRLVDGVTLNARPGSQWAIYPPDELQFRYGDAQAIAIVTELSGVDAVAQLRMSQSPIAPGARAIALAPPDVSHRQPLSLSGVEGTRRQSIMDLVKAEVPSAVLVPPGAFARLTVRFDGEQWQVLDAAGLQSVLTFDDMADQDVASRLAQVLLWSSHATSLLSLDNPASDIKLWVGVQTALTAQRPGSSTRGLMLVADDPSPAYRIRHGKEPRSPANSLMLEVRADRKVFISIASVDTEGQVHLLFPNNYQHQDFLPDGLISGNATLRIPDSLQSPNRAGFYWDFIPPVGKDTIRVFAAEDLATAKRIRDFIVHSGDDPNALQKLRSALTATAVRGIRIAPDHQAEQQPAGGQSALPAGQWAAASVTVRVTE